LIYQLHGADYMRHRVTLRPASADINQPTTT